MPCIPIVTNGSPGFICGFHPVYKYKGFIFEWHSYMGPIECEELHEEGIGTYYEPTNEIPTDEFYEAAQELFMMPPEEKDNYLVTESGATGSRN